MGLEADLAVEMDYGWAVAADPIMKVDLRALYLVVHMPGSACKEAIRKMNSSPTQVFLEKKMDMVNSGSTVHHAVLRGKAVEVTAALTCVFVEIN